MYDVVPDLLTAYWVSIGAAIVVGIVIGISITLTWIWRKSNERESPRKERDMISVKGYMVPSLAIGVRLLRGVWEYTYDLEKWFPCDKWPYSDECEAHSPAAYDSMQEDAEVMRLLNQCDLS